MNENKHMNAVLERVEILARFMSARDYESSMWNLTSRQIMEDIKIWNALLSKQDVVLTHFMRDDVVFIQAMLDVVVRERDKRLNEIEMQFARARANSDSIASDDPDGAVKHLAVFREFAEIKRKLDMFSN